MAEEIKTTNTFGIPGSGLMSEGFSVETVNSDQTVSMDEKEVAKETPENRGLVAFVKERFNRSKEKRLTDEQRWLSCYRNFRGLYGPDVQFTDTEQSKAFIKITKTKTLAAYAQITDILFAGNKFPIGIEESPVPEGIADAVYVDPKEPEAEPTQGASSSIVARPELKELLGPFKEELRGVQDKLKEGVGTTPSSFTWEPAKEAARRMENKIQDQLAETNADKALRSFVFEMCLLGTGIMKGPFARDKEYAKWNEEGKYSPVIKQVADLDYVSVWDSYPDPDAINMDDAEYFIQRHRMSKSQLRALKKRPFFSADAIEAIIQNGFNYTEEYWENTIKDNKLSNGVERFEVLEYWGVADADFEEITALKLPEQFKDKDQVQVNIWVCNGNLLRVVFNPFTPVRIPYYSCPYELNPYSFFGIGIAENMDDTQLLMNGFIRQAVDNAVLSGNVILEINENNLIPGQSLSLHPGKVFRTQGTQGQSIWSTKIENHVQDNLAMFDKARQLADEATGMPSYAHGQGGIQGIGRTAAGMSMLMGAAAQNIKSVVRNIDDYLLVPLGKALFAFNMQFDFDKDFIGDLEVVARGTQSLMRNEIRSQKLLQFLQLTNNPVDGPWAKRDYLLRELAQSLDLEADKAVNDPREAGIQAMMMQEMMKAQGIDPNQQKGQNPNGGPMNDQSPTTNGTAPSVGEQGYSGTGGGSVAAAEATQATQGQGQ